MEISSLLQTIAVLLWAQLPKLSLHLLIYKKVAFVMKRQVARVRFKITAYTQAIANIDAKLVSTANQPASISYSDLIANPQTVTSMSVNNEVTFPTTSNTKNILAFDFFTPYQYYLAGTDGTALKLSFSQGTVYQKSISRLRNLY